jgi:hypothetical protein
MDWATFWATFSQTRYQTIAGLTRLESKCTPFKIYFRNIFPNGPTAENCCGKISVFA